MKLNLKETLANYKRVLAISKKPSYDELVSTVRICALGIVLIGAIGFLIYLIAIFVSL